ncbi:MAG: hypothetical protein KKA07_02920 [Bacteroidetes bacterium]|nr:hypothetical protein [Bacteroidota bacterium]MBU1718003.1 hypothetical protein [Bacteroidota bacterium]
MKDSQPPHSLTDVGLSMFVDTTKLRELPLPIVEVPVEKLAWIFDMPIWAQDGTDDWNLTPWDVIKKKAGSTIHQQRVGAADLTYPIVLTEYNARLVALDGVHRLVKAYLQNQKKISAKIIPPEFLAMKEFQS